MAAIDEVVINNSSSLLKPYNYNSQYPDTIDLVVHRINIINFNNNNNNNNNDDDDVLVHQEDEIIIENNDKNIKFMTLDILGSISRRNYTIHYINDSKSLLTLVNDFKLFNNGLIGLDSEWRPRLLNDEKNIFYPVSILQLSLNDNIYIIDLQILNEDNNLMTILNDALSIFNDKNINVLGFGIKYDIEQLKNSYPLMNCFHMISNIIDIQSLYNNKMKNNKKNHSSLSAICKQFYNIDMNKNEQLSTWHIRPLYQNQLIYAAIDAAILPILYEKIISF